MHGFSGGDWKLTQHKMLMSCCVSCTSQCLCPAVEVRDLDFMPLSFRRHIEGSTNVQYYRWIEGWNLWKVARRFMFTFFGVVGTGETGADLPLHLIRVLREEPLHVAASHGSGGCGAGSPRCGCRHYRMRSCAAPPVRAEPNPHFAEEILEVSDPKRGVVLLCNLGGHLEEDYGPSPHGYQTR